MNNYVIKVRTSGGVTSFNCDSSLTHLNEFFPSGATEILASELSICEEGARFIIDPLTGREGMNCLVGFSGFLDILVARGASKARLLALRDQDAANLLTVYARHHQLEIVRIVQGELQCGKTSLDALRERNPAILDIPQIKQLVGELTIAGKLPKNKKRSALRKEEFELQALVAFKRQKDQSLSLENACAAACEERPEWVPVSWGENPEQNLQRQIARVWKKTPWGTFHDKK